MQSDPKPKNDSEDNKLESEKLLPKPAEPKKAADTTTKKPNKLIDSFNHFYIDPFKGPYYIWTSIAGLAYCYNLIFIIARASFWLLEKFHDQWFILDYFVSDVIYLIDILVINPFTAFMQNGELCPNKWTITIRYFKSSRFIMDVLSILPLELIFHRIKILESVSYLQPTFRLNRLLKTYRLVEFLKITESKTQYPTIFHMINLFLKILMAMHWNACIYFIISHIVGFGEDKWVFPLILEPKDFANLTETEIHNNLIYNTHRLDVQYIYSFWWSVLTLTTIGEVQQPEKYYQQFYMSFLLMIGVIILAITIGKLKKTYFKFFSSNTRPKPNIKRGIFTLVYKF